MLLRERLLAPLLCELLAALALGVARLARSVGGSRFMAAPLAPSSVPRAATVSAFCAAVLVWLARGWASRDAEVAGSVCGFLGGGSFCRLSTRSPNRRADFARSVSRDARAGEARLDVVSSIDTVFIDCRDGDVSCGAGDEASRLRPGGGDPSFLDIRTGETIALLLSRCSRVRDFRNMCIMPSRLHPFCSFTYLGSTGSSSSLPEQNSIKRYVADWLDLMTF